MRARHAQEKRSFARGDETDAMVQDHFLEAELGLRGLGDHLHLMLRHRPMRFIFDPGDFAAVFQRPDNSPKINRGARRAAPVIRPVIAADWL